MHDDLYIYLQRQDRRVAELQLCSLGYVEECLHKDTGHNLKRIFESTKGQLSHAAASILLDEKPVIRIITGFYIEKANKAETDGPLSAAQMASFFKLVGIECCVVTDHFCADICRAALKSAGCEDLLEVVEETPGQTIEDYKQKWSRSKVTHVIAIERPGPSYADIPRNMNGEDIHKCMQLNQLFERGSAKLIGIIDRGNELGSAALSFDVIANDIKDGGKIACKVGADFLIASRVSNWAASGLITALGILGEKKWLQEANKALAPKFMSQILQDMVDAGSVDGITHQCNINNPSVDSLALSHHVCKTKELQNILKFYSTGKTVCQNSSSGQYRMTSPYAGNYGILATRIMAHHRLPSQSP